MSENCTSPAACTSAHALLQSSHSFSSCSSLDAFSLRSMFFSAKAAILNECGVLQAYLGYRLTESVQQLFRAAAAAAANNLRNDRGSQDSGRWNPQLEQHAAAVAAAAAVVVAAAVAASSTSGQCLLKVQLYRTFHNRAAAATAIVQCI
jgi:hypothetical protein